MTHPDAFRSVAEQKAEWIGGDYQAIRILAAKIVPQGKVYEWRVLPSDGYMVLQLV